MEAKYLSLLSICFILVIILGISGCTSSNNVNPQTDIVLDGNLNGQWNNAEKTSWLVTGNLKSTSNTDYSQVTVKLTAYNSQNQVVGENTATTTISNGYGSINAVIPVTGQPAYTNMTVVNATQNTASDADTSKTKKKRR
ncbi:FxLYD domain-containing protein [Methanobacterium sp. MBAC-LM]|uniref:FxLYD domain-containing protein n=1 Tax=Methanobacterium sp. MBAC-LM TaxID=3412034 RepID=UPI003C76D4E4